MVPYKDMKAIVCSLDGNTDFFKILLGVIYVYDSSYVLQLSIDIRVNDFTLIKVRSRWYPCRNYYRPKLWRWSSTSCKYTNPSQISAV